MRQGLDLAVNFKKKNGQLTAKLGLTGRGFDSKINTHEEKKEYSYRNTQRQDLEVHRGYEL